MIDYINGVEGLCFFIVIFDCRALSLSCYHFIELAKDPVVGVPASRWQLWKLDRCRPTILVVLPGRLLVTFFPFRLNYWLFSTVVCIPSRFPRPVKLYAYIGGDFYLNYPWEGGLALRVFFPYRRCYITLCIEN